MKNFFEMDLIPELVFVYRYLPIDEKNISLSLCPPCLCGDIYSCSGPPMTDSTKSSMSAGSVVCLERK